VNKYLVLFNVASKEAKGEKVFLKANEEFFGGNNFLRNVRDVP
jgi:hypothetical protein